MTVLRYQKSRRRTYPLGDHAGAVSRAAGPAHDSRRWGRIFDAAQRVVVYWPAAPDSITLVGYYTTVSAANTAAQTAKNAVGALPKVAINWWHTTITHVQVGNLQHPDARVALPSWIDAEPIG